MSPNNIENLISELGSPDSPPEDDIMLGFKPSKPLVIENDDPPRQGKFPAKNKEQKELQTLANTHAQGSRSSDKSFAELRKLMPSGSFVQIQKAREDGNLSFIGEFPYSAIAPYGSIENYLAQVQRPKIGGGVFHVAMRDAASGNTIPAVPVHIEHLEKVQEMNTDAVALKLAEMVGARPANERIVEVAPAPTNSLENLKQTAAFLDEVKKHAPSPGDSIDKLLQFQQNAFENSLRQSQESQKILEEQKQHFQATIAAITNKPSGPDPVVVELANRFGRLEQAVSTPPPAPAAPPAPGVAEIIAAIGSVITPLLPAVLPLITPKPDTSGDALRLMLEEQRRADELRREEQRRADDLRREEQRRAEDQRREDEKIRREELREEQRRADELRREEERARREEEKARREEQREEQRRADEKMQALIASITANKPEGFSTKDVFEMERRHNQTLLDFIQSQNSGQSQQESLVEKMQELSQLKEVIEMINPPAAERSSSGGGDSTAATVIKALAPMAEGMFKALAPVMAQQMQQRPAPEIRYIPAPATVVSPSTTVVAPQPQLQGLPVIVDSFPPPTSVARPVQGPMPVAPQSATPVTQAASAETAPPEVVAGFQAIKSAQTPEQRVDSAVTMLMGLISHPDLSTVVLEMATAVAKKDQEAAVGRMHGFLMYGVERGWITKQDVLLTLQAFLKNWDSNRAKLLEQVPFLNMLASDTNETFVNLEGPKRPQAKTGAKVALVQEEDEEADEEEEDAEDDDESEDTDEDSESSDDDDDDESDESDVDRTEA